MKRVISILLLTSICNILVAQVDMYDITTHENVNVNKNINQNIHVGGAIYESKTIRTIDYGALAEANANMQRLQFERQQYEDEKQRRIALEMAANPIKAYDYGQDGGCFTTTGKEAEQYGFKKFSFTYRIPHNDFFYPTGYGRLENISPDGIVTEIIVYYPMYNMYNLPNRQPDPMHFNEYVKENEINYVLEMDSVPRYIYKKGVSKAIVFGVAGYKFTVIWEEEYQYCIRDFYSAFDSNVGNGISYYVKVQTYGSKEDTTFEKLEGRRYYFRPLIEKVISTAHLDSGYKVCKTKKIPERK